VKTGTNERPGLPIALVIGGGGMGMSTARRLGQSHRVVLASQSAKKNVEREAALREDGIDAVAVQCDVTDPDSVAELKEFVAERGPLRTLAHVAGLSPSAGDWRELFSVNLIGTALMDRACLELATQGTAAVFVSSSAGHLAAPPAPEIVAVLDDPLAPGFFDRLERLVPAEEQTSLQAYRLSKYALNHARELYPGAYQPQYLLPGPSATDQGR
jgi:NAD(P)-dependent dehydrogenase (short-subunit alcohol dehydrogenase family)